VRAGNTTVPGAHHTANSRAAAAQDTRPAAAAEVAGGAAVVAAAAAAAGDGVAIAAAAADGGPVGRRVWQPPTSVVAAVQANLLAPVAVQAAADRSTRGSKLAVHRLARTAARPAVVCDGMVCGGTESYGCGGSSRAGGAARRGTHTGWVAPVGSGPAPAVWPEGIGD